MEKSFTKISFLLIENDTLELKKMKIALKNLGATEVCIIDNASDAWAMMQIKEYDCVIASWNMPEMSGLSLLKVVRSDDRFFNMPFFLAHSNFSKISVIQAGQAGVTGLLVKPINPHILKEKLESLADVFVEKELAESEQTFEAGLLEVEHKNFDKALEIFNRLVNQEDSAEIYYNIGYIKAAQGKFDEAILNFRKATQIDRLFAKAYEAMGRIYKKIGRMEEAKKTLQKAADLYIHKSKMHDAETILNEILTFSAENFNVYNSLGVIYRKKGQLDKALHYYLKALKIHSKEPNIHYNIGRVYVEQHNYNMARKSFARALEIKSDFKDARDALTAIELGKV